MVNPEEANTFLKGKHKERYMKSDTLEKVTYKMDY